MGEQTKNMLIGVFVIAGCALVIWLILFLKPSVGDEKQTLYVRFSNINRINVGTLVLFAGKPVGEVVAIEPIHDARQKPSVDLMGNIYFYQLELKIDSKVKVYDTDEVAIETSGLLGEKSIAIIPKKPPKGVTPKLITTQPIYADSFDPLENAIVEIKDLANDMQTTFQLINSWLQKNSDELGYAITSFANTMDEARLSFQTINDNRMLFDLQEMTQEITQTFDALHTSITTLNDSDTFTNAAILVNNLKNTSISIEEIAQDIAEGKGTLGRLIKGDDLYLSFNAVLSKINTMMNDINHYGILFHLNKSWQRQRAARMTVLNALDTPQSFKNYFESEVDEIHTAMARLSLLIDRAQLSPKKEEIFNDDVFKRDFAELLRQAESLSDSLKLYNEELMQSTPEVDDGKRAVCPD